jgi:predicted DNA-binding transcriptional regulator YafY
VAEYYDTDQVAEHGDGSVEVTLPTKHLGWVARLALRLGDAVEVIGPDGLTEEIREVAAATLARYSENGP